MQITYKPEDSPGEGWEKDFDPRKVKTSRAEMIEKRYGNDFATFVKKVQQGEAKARRVLMWHLLSLSHPTTRMEDIPDFAFGELEVEYSVADLQRLRAEVAASSLDDAGKAESLEALDMEIATRLLKDTEELTAEDLGKAEAPSATDASAS